jgi:hypothetical protein
MMDHRTIKTLLSLVALGISSTVFAGLINTVSLLINKERDSRGTDYSFYSAYGIALNNYLQVNPKVYLELDNQISTGPGDYHITNPYSIPGVYPSNTNKYSGRLIVGHPFALPDGNQLLLGIGGGFRHLYYKAHYNQPLGPDPDEIVSGVSRVVFVYNEGYIPIEANITTKISENLTISFNNILAFGIHGLGHHIFTGPGGFNDPSYHNSISYFPAILLNYKQFSFGPWASYNYFTLGQYNGEATVSLGNQLTILEYGLKASYRV